jgi:hypothetical protein
LINSKNLLLASDFPLNSKNGENFLILTATEIWKAEDPPLPDWSHFEYKKMKEKTGIFHNFHSKHQSQNPPGAIQIIKPDYNLKKYRGEFLMSFRHISKLFQG